MSQEEREHKLLYRLTHWRAKANQSRSKPRRRKPPGLTVFLFNVGQGDHILLKLPNGEYGIIDSYYETRLGLKEPPALTLLDSLMTKDSKKPIISFICISHPD